jgi:hypothetical protein
MARRTGLSLEAWPPEDRTLWERAFTPASYFDSSGEFAAWRPATRRQAYYAYSRWLGYLLGKEPLALDEPAATRFTLERGRVYREHCSARLSTMGLASELNHLPLALRVIAPTADWSWLHAWQVSIAKREHGLATSGPSSSTHCDW